MRASVCVKRRPNSKEMMEDTDRDIQVPVAGLASAVVVTGENAAAMIERAISVPRAESTSAEDAGRGRSPGPAAINGDCAEDARGEEEKGRISNRLQLIGMTAFGFSASMVMMGMSVIVPQFIGRMFANPAIILGTITAVAHFLQLLGLAASYFSDRCTLRLGRRRPFILAAGALTVLSALMLIIGLSRRVVWLFVGGYWAMFLGLSIGQQANSALVSDLASKDRVGFAGSAQGLWFAIGGVIGLALLAVMRSLTIVCVVYIVSAVLSVALAMVCAREQPLSKDSEILRRVHAESCCGRFWHSLREFFGSFLFSVRRFPDFFMMLIFRMLSMGTMAPLAFLQYYLRDTMGDTTPALTQSVFMLLTFGCTFIFSPLVGFLNDATKRPRLTIIFGCVISGFGLSVFLWAKTRALPVFLSSVALGTSISTVMASSFPVNVSVMPSRKNAAQYFAEFVLFQFVSFPLKHAATVASHAAPQTGFLASSSSRKSLVLCSSSSTSHTSSPPPPRPRLKAFSMTHHRRWCQRAARMVLCRCTHARDTTSSLGLPSGARLWHLC